MPSEFELIRTLAARLGKLRYATLGIGDDAAMFPDASGRPLLMASDILVETVHFRRDWSTPADVGWKAVAVNVSDIAAMGGEPLVATTSIAVADPADALPLMEGVIAAAAAFGVDLIGGDTTRSPGPLVIDVAIVGRCAQNPVLRSGARPGDGVYVTGALGAAAAALAWLTRSTPQPVAAADSAPGIDPAQWERLLTALRRPRPPYAAGPILAAAGATAMIDISDGIAGDAGHIAEQSGIAIDLFADKLPLAPGVAVIAQALGRSPLELALHGGEDFQLLVCLPEEKAGAAAERLAGSGVTLTQVGRCVRGRGVRLLDANGNSRPLLRGGYEHFRSPDANPSSG